MGLKMPDEEDGFASKILLMRAGNKSRAQSWLKTSLGEDPGVRDDTASSVTETTTDIFADLQGNEENAGVGTPKKQNEDVDHPDKQVLSANDALRKKLLGRDAYQRYQQRSVNKMDASKPMPKTRKKIVDDESGDEEEGRSRVAKSKLADVESTSFTESSGTASRSRGANQKVASNLRKRPGSYLDQLLAERGKKKKLKPKSEDG